MVLDVVSKASLRGKQKREKQKKISTSKYRGSLCKGDVDLKKKMVDICTLM
jgi:hypothetical protein